MKRGQYVTRSVYQKLAEENKRLKADIRVLVELQPNTEAEVYKRWKQKFKEEKDFKDLFRAIIEVAAPPVTGAL